MAEELVGVVVVITGTIVEGVIITLVEDVVVKTGTVIEGFVHPLNSSL
jgi:hypothetical protein